MNIQELVQRQRRYFATGATRPLAFRRRRLRALREALLAARPEIEQALKADLNKSSYETFLTELAMVVGEIDDALRHLEKWAAPRRRGTPLSHFPAVSRVYPEPYGVVLVLSPWNYPLQLALAPVVGAIAAGNCVLVKASRHSAHTTALLHRLLSRVFSPEYVACVDETIPYGDVLAQRYDMIFFTGSPRVGRQVMAAAAAHLTPVVLELGGKSPCFVDAECDLAVAARRIAWGKLLNAGQTCVAPDYVLVDSRVKDRFIELLMRQAEKMFPHPLHDPDYPRIVSRRHYDRLCGLLDRATGVRGGARDAESLHIALAVVEADFDSEVMREEIFGPILPVIAYDRLDDAVQAVQKREKPLACYVFTRRAGYARAVLERVSFGGGCVNDVVMHLANHNLPFGGVGNSGMGSYHGKDGFDTFSHHKSVLHNRTLPDIPLRYAPYNEKNLPLLQRVLLGR